MIRLTKEIKKQIAKEDYYTEERFIKDCRAYIKAVDSGRIQYTVTHVSQSGMSRNIMIKSYEGTMNDGFYRWYYKMLEAMGYKFASDNSIKVSGCGMDMLFATNYNIIHSLKHMGFIYSKRCASLAQKV